MKLNLLSCFLLSCFTIAFSQKIELKQRNDFIACAFSPEGKNIAIATTDSIRLIPLDGGKHNFLKPWNSIYCLTYSTDGNLIAAGGHGGSFQIWNKQGKFVGPFSPPKSFFQLTALSFSKDDKEIAAGYSNNEVIIWGIDGQIKQHLNVLDTAKDNSTKDQKKNDSEDILMELGSEEDRDYRWKKKLEDYKKNTQLKKASITSLVFSPHEQTLITGSTDSTIRIWTLQGKLLHTYRSPLGSVNSISMTSDGVQFLTTHHHTVALLWDKKGKILRKIKGHIAPIISANFTTNNEIITISRDGMIRKHGAKPETLMTFPETFLRMQHVYSAITSPDGKFAVSIVNQNKAQIWDLAAPIHHEQAYILEDNPVTTIAFSPKRDLFVSGGKDIDRIRLWDSTGRLLHTYMAEGLWGVNDLAFAPDGQSFLVACPNGNIFQWHINGTPIQLLSDGSKSLLKVAFSTNGQEVIAVRADSMIMVWNLQEGELIRKFSTKTSILSAVITPKSNRVLIGDKMGNVSIWETSGKRGAILISGQKPISSMAVFQNQRILIGLEDNSTALYNFQGKFIQQISPAHSWAPQAKHSPIVAFAPGGKKLFVSDQNGGIIKNLTKDSTYRIKLRPSAAVFTHQGSSLITGTHNDGVSIWDTQGRQTRIISKDPGRFRSLAFPAADKQFLTISDNGEVSKLDFSLRSIEQYAEGYTAMAFHTDAEKSYILAGATDGFIHLMDDKKQILWSKKVGDSYGINCLAFSPDGKTLFIGRKNMGYVQLRDIEGKLTGGFFGHRQDITSVAFAPNGSSFITGSLDSTAGLWSLQGDTLQVFNGHAGVVNTVAFAPDGKSVLTGGSDGFVKHWDLTGKLIQSFHTQSFEATSVAFSPDGKYILTGNKYSGKPAILWDLKGNLLRAFHENFTIETAHDAKFSPDGKYVVFVLNNAVVRVENWQPK